MKEKGIRKTSAREAILTSLSRSESHLSAEDIYLMVHSGYPNIGLTTVYRTLNILSRLGLVCKFDFGDGRARFELLEQPEGYEHHHHLVCTSCQKVCDYTDFVDEELELVKKTEKALSKRFNFKINSHVIQFYGLCNKCRGKNTI